MHKILLVSSEFPPGPGGIGHHAYSLCKELQKKENINLLILSNADYIAKDKVANFDSLSGLNIVRFKKIGKATKVYRVIQFLSYLLKFKPDTIIFTGLFSLWLMNFTISLSKINNVAIIHGHEPIFGNKFFKWLTRISLKRANTFVVVSTFSKQVLERNYQISSHQKLKVIPNGLDVNYLESWNTLSINSKELTPVLVEGFPKLITIGHTSPRKGQHNVIKALPKLKEKYPNIIYYIVGRNVNNSGLEKLAMELNVSDNIQFLPAVEEHHNLERYYRNADIFMLLSENQSNGDVEGFGIVVLEANYFGLPVIGAKNCGVEEAIDNGHTGVLVDVNNVNEISFGISNILDNPEKFNKDNLNQWISRFKWDVLINDYL